MQTLCIGSLRVAFYNGGLGNVWTGHLGFDEDGVTLLPVVIPCTSGNITVDATLTITSTAPGGVEVKFLNGATVVARWISIAAFQPHCWLAMKLVEYDKSCFECAKLWAEYTCLESGPRAYGCLCDGDLWAYRVRVAMTLEFDVDDYITCFTGSGWTTADAESAHAFDKLIADAISSFEFVTEGGLYASGCQWTQTVLITENWYTDPVSGDPVPLYLRAVVSLGFDGTNYFIEVQVGIPGQTRGQVYQRWTLTNPGVPDSPGSMPIYCTEGPWNASSTHTPSLCSGLSNIPFSWTVDLIPVRIPTTRSGYVSPECILSSIKTCEGTSLWRLVKIVTSPGNGTWAWELVSSTCEFWCENTTQWCKALCPTSPVIPEGEISDAAAATAGLVEDAEHIGTCGCGEDCNGNNPNPTNCLGTSVWYLRRTLCDLPDSYIYYWEMEDNTCSGACGEPSECAPDIPFELPETPIDDTTADGLGLLALVDTTVDAGCSCNDNAYVPPNCPEECSGTCDYTIAGYTSACGSFGTLAGTLVIDITDDGTSGGTHLGYVYLNVSSNNCTTCGCISGTRYSTTLAYWGIGGFPCGSGLVGSPGGTFNCE